MQENFLPRRRGIPRLSPMLPMLPILLLGNFTFVNGSSCEFPPSWAGEWYQYGKPPSIVINSTVLGGRTCVERSKHSYVVFGENCYQCMIINDRHENVIQYREGWCISERSSLEEICSTIKSDDTLFSMFRVDSKPIPCPFSGPSFTFTYDKGYGECATPISLAERCTDESKLLLKYQACADVEGTESNVEELQCLAVWNDGRNKYLVGTLKGRNALGSGGKTYRCFLYEEKAHHQGKMVYLLAQSGDPTCNGLTTVSEGSPAIKLTRVDKEHNRCKYPSWITEHHDWHSLDGSRIYHFTNKNATLKVRAREVEGDGFREEKIVCHNLEKSVTANEEAQLHEVKLVAHVTSGCDIGYVCMIFHKRDRHVVELQQSSQKAIMPNEACSLWDPSTMPYTTLISSSLRRRKCPNPGRYSILGFAPFRLSGASAHRQGRGVGRFSRNAKGGFWQEAQEDVDRAREQEGKENATKERRQAWQERHQRQDNNERRDDSSMERKHRQHQRREEDRKGRNRDASERAADAVEDEEDEEEDEEDDEVELREEQERDEEEMNLDKEEDELLGRKEEAAEQQEDKQRQQRREEECETNDVHVGCGSSDRSEIIVGKTCERRESAYYCHGSWEEEGTWYTIVSQKTTRISSGLGRTFCFSMRFSGQRGDDYGKSGGGGSGGGGLGVAIGVTERRLGKGGGTRPFERELWLSRPERTCRREPRGQEVDEWAYRLVSRGACEDAAKAATSLAALTPVLSFISHVSFVLVFGSYATQRLLLLR